MKKFVVFIIFCLFLVGCTNLPPEPETLGGVGKAIGVLPDWAADPGNKFTTSPNPLIFTEDAATMKANVQGDQFVYKYGYIYVNNNWEVFSFSEDTVGTSNWIGGDASVDVVATKDQMPEGNYFMVAYSCSKVDEVWQCNGNKWMLRDFIVKEMMTDIGIKSVTWSDSVIDNEPTSIQVLLENVGIDIVGIYEVLITPAPGCSLLVANQEGVDFAPGTTQTKTFQMTCNTLGIKSHTITIDPSNKMLEIDKTNNVQVIDSVVYECNSGETKCVDDNSFTICIDGSWPDLPPSPCDFGETCSNAVCGGVTSGAGDYGDLSVVTCSDGNKNNDETDVDCGGSCSKCIDGKTCLVDVDCVSNDCISGICTTLPTCIDTIKNQDETDVDCGGICDGCSLNLDCVADNDCLSVYCGQNKCKPYFQCIDSDAGQKFDVKGSATGVSFEITIPAQYDDVCDGSKLVEYYCLGNDVAQVNETCSYGCLNGACKPQPTCFDGIKNQDETATDCGGSCAANCAIGKNCSSANDCTSNNCVSGVCLALPTCFDGIKNQDETATDCGGSCAVNCGTGQLCNTNADCTSNVCDGTCVSCYAATTYIDTGKILDSYTSSWSVADTMYKNHGAERYWYVGRNQDLPIVYRSYFKPILDALIPQREIQSAEFTWEWSSVPTCYFNLEAVRIASGNWAEGNKENEIASWPEITWVNQNQVGLSSDKINFVSSTKSNSLDISDWVRGWYTGAYSNYGFVFKLVSETSGHCLHGAPSRECEGSCSGIRPRLIVKHLDPRC